MGAVEGPTVGPTLDNAGPRSTQTGRYRVKLGPRRATRCANSTDWGDVVTDSTNLEHISANPADVGQIWAKLEHIWTNLANVGRVFTQLCLL